MDLAIELLAAYLRYFPLQYKKEDVYYRFSRAGLHAYAMNNDYGPRTYLEKMKSFEAPRCDPSSGGFTDVLFSRRDERAIRWAGP